MTTPYEKAQAEVRENYYKPQRRNGSSGCTCNTMPFLDEKTGVTGMLDENNVLLPEGSDNWYQKLIFQRRCSGCGKIYWPYYLYPASALAGVFLGGYIYLWLYPIL